MRWFKKHAAGLGLCATASLVFFAYTRPDFIVTTANQIWLCF